MFILILILVLSSQVWTWIRLTQGVASGKLTKLGASGGYALWALMPIIIYLIGFFGTIGLEELLGLPLVPELLARATILILAVLLGSAILGTLCFSVRCAFLKT